MKGERIVEESGERPLLVRRCIRHRSRQSMETMTVTKMDSIASTETENSELHSNCQILTGIIQKASEVSTRVQEFRR